MLTALQGSWDSCRQRPRPRFYGHLITMTLYDIISIISGTIHIQMPCLVRSWLPCHKEETFCLVPSPVAGQDHFGISPNQQTLQHPAGLLGLRQHQNVKQATLSSNICAFPKRIMYIVHTHTCIYIYIIQYIYIYYTVYIYIYYTVYIYIYAFLPPAAPTHGCCFWLYSLRPLIYRLQVPCQPHP